MARRKKEPQNVHRKAIAMAAEQLFMKHGIENTSMNDIVRESGYSKATLYVYFKDKEELIGVLALESMQKLYGYMRLALEKGKDTKECYWEICYALVRYQEEYPFYFKMVLETINIDFEASRFLPEEKETFRIGEQINDLLTAFFKRGMDDGVFRSDVEILPTIFSFWGMLAGLIQITVNKEAYIRQYIKKNKTEFLENGFTILYDSITVRK